MKFPLLLLVTLTFSASAPAAGLRFLTYGDSMPSSSSAETADQRAKREAAEIENHNAYIARLVADLQGPAKSTMICRSFSLQRYINEIAQRVASPDFKVVSMFAGNNQDQCAHLTNYK